MAESATPNSTVGKHPSTKDKRCPFCHQTFTSSSLGRHLDLYIREKNAKPPDDVHDVEEIRKIRAGITRRQARSSTKRDASTPSSTKATPQREQQSPPSHKIHTDATTDDGRIVKTYWNTANWQATGVINDLPPTPREDQVAQFQRRTISRRASVKEDLTRRQTGLDERDRGQAAELALKEVLESLKAASARAHPALPFDFNFFSLSLPQMYLRCLSPPPNLLSGPPALHDASWTIDPPGTADYEALRGWLHDRLHDWRRRRANLQFGNNPPLHGIHAQTPISADNSPVHGEEAMYYEHLSKAHRKWADLSARTREEQWHYECAKAFAREQERHQATARSLQHAEDEIKLLRNHIAQMNANILPPESAQFQPSALPLTSDSISHLTDANSLLFDCEASIAKWKSRIRCARSTQAPLPPASGPPLQQPTDSDASHRFGFLERAAAQEAQGSALEHDDDGRGGLEDAPGDEDDDAYNQHPGGRKALDSRLKDRESMAQPQHRGGRRIMGFGAGFRGSERSTDVEMESS